MANSTANKSNTRSLCLAMLKLGVSLVAAATVVLVSLTLGGFAARWHWRLEQACHFRVQYAWMLGGAVVFLLIGNRRWIALTAVAGVLLNLSAILPLFWPIHQPIATGNTLRIVSFNVLSSNSRYSEVHAFLRSQKADVVLLMEVSPAWAKQLEILRDLYPHQHAVPRTDNFGIALLSREPWQTIDTCDLGGAGVPTLIAMYKSHGYEWHFVGTHPLPPGSAHMAQLRNDQLVGVTEFVRECSGPVILAGDLNVTEFSPYFQELLRQAALVDTRQGIGIQASWSPRLPILRIPIDHCLVTPDIAVRRRQVGPVLGSDHRPITVELTLSR